MAKTKPKPHYSTHPKGHVWKREEDGAIDIFGHSSGHHNGPICILCAYSFCHHCIEVPKSKCTATKKQRAAIVKALRETLVP